MMPLALISGCDTMNANVSVVGNVGELTTEHLSHAKLLLKY